MTVTVKHPFVSTVPDSTDTSLVRPSNWNADHTIVGLGTAAELNAGVANGVASLDSAGTVPISQLPAAVLGALSYQGTWNASTNTPTLASSTGTKGYYYVVSVAGSTNLNGITDWKISDWAVFNGSVWQKIDNTDSVTSVNGYTGAVNLTYTDVGAFPSTPTSGANSIVLRDANQNVSANSFFSNAASVAAAGTTTVLTAASTANYTVTGSGGQTFQLPDATTLPVGASFIFNNNQSSGTIVVKNNSSTTIATIQSGGFVTIYLLANTPAAGSWDIHYEAPSNVSWSTNTLDYAGSITSATWNGNVVQVNRGGTGAATLTGYVKGSGTSALTASSTIPNTDISGLGTISTQNANAIAITGGAIDGTTVGSTTAAAGSFTTLNSSGATRLGGLSGNQSLQVNNVASAVNYVQTVGATTTNAPTISAQGSDANIGLNYECKGSANHNFKSAGGFTQFSVASAASSVDYFVMSGSSGGYPTMYASGASANIGLTTLTKGTGGIFLKTGGGQQLSISDTASAVNNVQITGALTTASPNISAVGSDININLKLTPKGTGGVQFTGPLLPNNLAGTSGQVLTSAGAGAVPTWATPAGSNITAQGLYENSATISANYTIGTGNNAVSAGPITINSGIVVTVPSGSTWVIV